MTKFEKAYRSRFLKDTDVLGLNREVGIGSAVNVYTYVDSCDEHLAKIYMGGYSAIGIAEELDECGYTWDYATVYEFKTALTDGEYIGTIIR